MIGKRLNSHKDNATEGQGSRAGVPSGVRSLKGPAAQSGDDKSQSQLEESLGAIVGSGIKKTGLS